jgi:hypothetical protein
MNVSYEIDFFAWTEQQSKLLRLGKFDLENLADEIELLVKQQRQELSWVATIRI